MYVCVCKEERVVRSMHVYGEGNGQFILISICLPMLLAKRIEMRSSRGTTVGIVTELMDVHATLGVGVVACDVVGDGCRGGFGGLLEGDGSLDVGVTAEDCDCLRC
jgi:hypothetical protein